MSTNKEGTMSTETTPTHREELKQREKAPCETSELTQDEAEALRRGPERNDECQEWGEAEIRANEKCEKCEDCEGTGEAEMDDEYQRPYTGSCWTCGGSGTRRRSQGIPLPTQPKDKGPCETCGESGKEIICSRSLPYDKDEDPFFEIPCPTCTTEKQGEAAHG